MKPLHTEPGYSKANLFLKILILVWPFLFIWQGVDLTDTGYLLSGGQQVFVEPQNVQFSYLLSFVITGIWSRITAFLGLMGAYLGGAFLYILTAFCVYRTLRKQMPERILLLGLLLAVMIPNLMRYINYNNLTSLFFVLGSAVLIKAFTSHRQVYYFLAGIIFGSSFYLRLPNLVSISLALVIVAEYYLNGSAWKDILKGSLFFISGFISALIVPFMILHIWGLSDHYFETFQRLLGFMTDSSSHHSGEGLIRKVILDFDRTFAAFFKSFIIFAILAKINDIFQSRILRTVTIVLSLAVVFLIGSGFIGKTAAYHYYILGFIEFMLLLQVLGFTSSKGEIRFASLLAFMVMMFGMAGSNTGLSAARYNLWLALPLSLHGLFTLKGLYLCEFLNVEKGVKVQNGGISLFSEKGMKMTRKIIFFSMALFFLILCYRFSYKDSEERYLMRYNIDHPKMQYVFTTRERAEVMTEALNELSKYVLPGDYLLAYNYIPLFHYLTDTRPYVYHSWPDMYSPEQLIDKLKQAIAERHGLPPVIRSKYPPLNDSWPEKHLSGRGSARHHQVFDEFLKQGKYIQVWENEFFQILLPPSSW